MSRVGIEVGVGVTMMGTVTPRPPLDGTLDGTSTSEGKTILERLGGVVRTMRPQTMVTCNTKRLN